MQRPHLRHARWVASEPAAPGLRHGGSSTFLSTSTVCASWCVARGTSSPGRTAMRMARASERRATGPRASRACGRQTTSRPRPTRMRPARALPGSTGGASARLRRARRWLRASTWFGPRGRRRPRHSRPAPRPLQAGPRGGSLQRSPARARAFAARCAPHAPQHRGSAECFKRAAFFSYVTSKPALARVRVYLLPVYPVPTPCCVQQRQRPA